MMSGKDSDKFRIMMIKRCGIAAATLLILYLILFPNPHPYI